MNKPSIFQKFLRELRKAASWGSHELTWREKRQLFESFHRMVRKHLPEGGWKYAGCQFKSRNGQCERIFFSSITDQKLELWVDVGVGIRFANVEEIWRRAQNLEGTISHWTVFGAVDHYIRKPLHFFQIDRPSDIEFFEPSICEVIEQACVPFWKRFATVADADREWNHRPFEFPRDVGDVFHHATRSVIVAKLANNPAFEKIVAIRREEVRRILDITLLVKGLAEFDRLVEWLRKEPIPAELI